MSLVFPRLMYKEDGTPVWSTEVTKDAPYSHPTKKVSLWVEPIEQEPVVPELVERIPTFVSSPKPKKRGR